MELEGKSAYFVSATVGLHSQNPYPIECLMDTGAQPNSISKYAFPEHWTVRREAAGNVHLRSAFKDSIAIIGKIDLHVRIGDSLTEGTFRIVDKLALNILLGTSFIV